MDLAKIRKKAKAEKNEAAGSRKNEKRGTAREQSSLQATPADSVLSPTVKGVAGHERDRHETVLSEGTKVASVTPETSDESRPSVRRDPLDELFRHNADIQLATEESYLDALNEDQAEDEATRQCLTFSLADEEYALDIEAIDEICKLREITDIPNVPSFVLGIISLRGKIVPVYDLKSRLQLGRVDVGPASRIVVCQVQDKLVGLLVDSITQVVRLADSAIEPPPMVLSGLDRDMVEGVGRSDGRMLILLNLNNVITIDTEQSSEGVGHG